MISLPKSRLLLIGGTGFAGSCFVELFKEKYNIHAVGSECDITNKADIEGVVLNFKPDLVVNLAGITTLRAAERDLNLSADVMFVGELNLLNVLNATNFTGSHLYVSSGEVYGSSEIGKQGYSETSEVLPDSIYGQCKYFTERLCYAWENGNRYRINVARPFNHIGVGQSEDFAIANFAKQIARIKKYGFDRTLYVGDLTSQRDFSDVSEVVSAYEIIINSDCDRELFNICSGKPISLKLMLDKMIEISAISVNIEIDDNLLRKSVKPKVFGNNAKMRNELNFVQEKSLDLTLKEILEFWYEKV